MLSCQLLFRLDSENQDEKLLIRNSRQILRIAFQLNAFVNEITSNQTLVKLLYRETEHIAKCSSIQFQFPHNFFAPSKQIK